MGAAASHCAEQVQDTWEVETFLRDLGLQFYISRVLLAGFADLESLKAVESHDLAAIGFAPTHADRLLLKLGKRASFPLSVQARPVEANPPDYMESLPETRSDAPVDCSDEVVEFLAENGLAMYADAMLSNGFDDMEALLLMEDEDMRELGIPRGHMLKLRRKLRELEANTSTESAAMTPRLATSQMARGVSCSSAASSSAASSSQHRSSVMSLPPGQTPTLPVFGGSIPMVRTSWSVIRDDIGTDVMARRLFSQLIVKAPLCLKLFGDESDDTQPMILLVWLEKFVKYIGATVCDEFEHKRLVQTLSRMGAARVATDVTPEHWQLLGNVLDLTLSETLGDIYTLDVRDAWMSAYQYMSAIMIDSMCTAKSVVAEMTACIAMAQSGDQGEYDLASQAGFARQAAVSGA